MEQNFISQTPLDRMVSSDCGQMLKAAIPYLPASGRQILSVYEKAMELKNTISLFGSSTSAPAQCHEYSFPGTHGNVK